MTDEVLISEDIQQIQADRALLRAILEGSPEDVVTCLQGIAGCDSSEESSSPKRLESESNILPDAYFQDSSVSDRHLDTGIRSLMGPLHYAVLSPIILGPFKKLELLLDYGCPWNAVDIDGNTAADLARAKFDAAEISERPIYDRAYKLLLDTGIRTEFFLHRLNKIQIDDEEAFQEDNECAQAVEATCPAACTEIAEIHTMLDDDMDEHLGSDNVAFLNSRLSFLVDDHTGQGMILTSEGDAVMMNWEQDVMRHTADLLCHEPLASGATQISILNIGFGLGLIDSAFQKCLESVSPQISIRHVIVEPHPDVLAFMKHQGWQEGTASRRGLFVFQGTWRQYLESCNEQFDIIYYDTFSEHWSDLSDFLGHLPRLLKERAANGTHLNPKSDATPRFASQEQVSPSSDGPAGPRFSFFHGLGATNHAFYDVYTAIAQIELEELGFRVMWRELPITPKSASDQAHQDIKRPYFSLPVIRIPIVYRP